MSNPVCERLDTLMNVVSHRNELQLGAPDSDLSTVVECPFRIEHDDYLTAETPVGLIGISYHTATLQVRSRVGVAASGLDQILRRFAEVGFDECLVLSTCNRTEIYFVGGSHAEAEQILADESGLTFDELRPHLYSKSGACAAHHLFGVASGLDSAVLGETEILAQIKDAVATGRRSNSIGRHIDFLVRRSQAASRRVRTETDLCKNVTSVGSLAVRDASHKTGGLTGKTVVVVGAGKIAERIAKDLVLAGTPTILFVNRTFANAESLAARYGGQPQPYSELESSLTHADVVFTAASCDTPIIDHEAVQRINQARSGKPLTLVDLGVPRNTHASAKSLPEWNVLDMDVLSTRCGENSSKRMASIPRAVAIMDEELEDYLTECKQRAAAPTIQALMKFGEGVKQQNLDWANERLSHLSEKDLRVVADLATRMVKGFLQAPIQELKEELTTEQQRDLVLKLFQLESGGR